MRRMLAVSLLIMVGCRSGVSTPGVPAVELPRAPDSAVMPPVFPREKEITLPAHPSRPQADASPVATAVALETGPARLPAVSPVSMAAYDEQEAAAEPLPLPQAADPSTTEFSLADLEQIALANNPSVAEAAAKAEAAYGNWIQVGLPPNFVVGYSGQQLGSRGLAEQQGVYMAQEIVTGKKLRLNRNVAAWELEQAQRVLAAQEQRVLTDVRVAFYDVLIAQQRRDLAGQLVEIGQRGVRATEALFKGQEVSEADPLRAKIEADMARMLLTNAENQLDATWRVLAAAMGVPTLERVVLVGSLELESLEGSWENMLTEILAASPEMAAALARIEAAHWAVHRAEVQKIPNIDVQGIVQQDNSTQSSNGSLQVSVPLPLLNRNQGGVREAQAQLAAAQLAVDRLALDLQTRFADAYRRYANARNQVDRYTAPGGILENAERTMELIRTGYEAGEFAVLDLVTAQRTYFQTNLAYLDSLQEFWTAAMEIRGLLLKGSLSTSP